jgi:hypothetical protein
MKNKIINGLQEGYLDSRDASNELNISQSAFNSNCKKGIYSGCIKFLKGKQERWAVPAESIRIIINEKKDLEDNYYTLSELADELGCHPVTIRNLLDKQGLATKKIHRITYLKKDNETVLNLLEQRI